MEFSLCDIDGSRMAAADPKYVCDVSHIAVFMWATFCRCRNFHESRAFWPASVEDYVRMHRRMLVSLQSILMSSNKPKNG